MKVSPAVVFPYTVSPGSITEVFCKIGEQEWSRLKVKFDITYFVPTENMAVANYPKLCHLEALNEVDLGNTYHNNVTCKTFCVTLLCNLSVSP